MEKYLTEQEMKILLSEPLDKQKKILIQIGLETGVRVSEVVGIYVRNIKGNFIKLYDYKKYDWRTLVISDGLAEQLAMYIASTSARKRGPRKLFHVTERTVNNWLKKIFVDAGLPKSKAHWHTFRHTFIRRCQHLGHDPSFTMAQAGDNSETILGFYGIPSLDERPKTLWQRPLYGLGR